MSSAASETFTLLTIFIICDDDCDNVPGTHHGTAPVVTQRCPKMHLELFFRLKNRVIVDDNRTVFDLRNNKTFARVGLVLKKLQADMWIQSNFYLLSFKESDARLICVAPLLEVVHHHG